MLSALRERQLARGWCSSATSRIDAIQASFAQRWNAVDAEDQREHELRKRQQEAKLQELSGGDSADASAAEWLDRVQQQATKSVADSKPDATDAQWESSSIQAEKAARGWIAGPNESEGEKVVSPHPLRGSQEVGIAPQLPHEMEPKSAEALHKLSGAWDARQQAQRPGRISWHTLPSHETCRAPGASTTGKLVSEYSKCTPASKMNAYFVALDNLNGPGQPPQHFAASWQATGLGDLTHEVRGEEAPPPLPEAPSFRQRRRALRAERAEAQKRKEQLLVFSPPPQHAIKY